MAGVEVAAQLFPYPKAGGVVADRRVEADIGSGAGGGHRLVRPFAAKSVNMTGRVQRLARPRKAAQLKRRIDADIADDMDAHG
ncbi:hypothetical protein MesoLj131c_52650 [Mesorhizobium sp. 131-3-5]|nr:hypothetical protein MesoLj131b_51830 [Mesorhizobium sp. 131-2-5]BCH11007.1 hypothetical protein MesoLj131c_52650 [Mesorhizobium sp. 131-3-5]